MFPGQPHRGGDAFLVLGPTADPAGGERLWGPLGAAGFVLGSVSTLPPEPAPSVTAALLQRPREAGSCCGGRHRSPARACRGPPAWLPGADSRNRCFRHSPQPAGRADVRTRDFFKFLKHVLACICTLRKGIEVKASSAFPLHRLWCWGANTPAPTRQLTGALHRGHGEEAWRAPLSGQPRATRIPAVARALHSGTPPGGGQKPELRLC